MQVEITYKILVQNYKKINILNSNFVEKKNCFIINNYTAINEKRDV